MNFSNEYEFIGYMKPFAKDIMINHNIPASVIIAYWFDKWKKNEYKLDVDYETETKNILYKAGLLNNNGVLSINNSIKPLCDNIEEIKNIIISYRLIEFDIEIQDQFIFTKNVVDKIVTKRPIPTIKQIETSEARVGMVIELKNANVYKNWRDSMPYCSISGTFRLAKAKVYIDKYKIKNLDDDTELGYVKIKHIKIPSTK